MVDAANVLSPESRARLDGWIEDFRRQTGYRLVVATLPSLNGEGITPVAHRLSAEWGMENGIILLEAPNEYWVRIEVGPGLRNVLPDVLCGTLLRLYIPPALRELQMEEGLEGGAVAIMRQLGWTGDAAGAPPPRPFGAYFYGIFFPDWLIAIILALIACYLRFVRPYLFGTRGCADDGAEIVYSYMVTPEGLRRTDAGGEGELIPFDDGEEDRPPRRQRKRRKKNKRRCAARRDAGASGRW